MSPDLAGFHDSLYNNILNDSAGTIYPGTAVSVKIQGTTTADTLTKSVYMERAELVASVELAETKRGTGGFGHSGVK